MSVDEIDPLWTLAYKDSPTHGKIIQLTILLPGLQDDGSGLQFSFDADTRCLVIAVPGELSDFEIPLDCTINPTPLELQYDPGQQVLFAVLSVTAGSPFDDQIPDGNDDDPSTSAAPPLAHSNFDQRTVVDRLIELSAALYAEDEDNESHVPSSDHPTSSQQQAKKKKKNKKGGGGGGGNAQNSQKTQPSSSKAAAPAPSSSYPPQNQPKEQIQSHTDALKEHLTLKIYNKLIDTFLMSTGTLSVLSIILFVTTLGSLRNDTATVSLCPTWIPRGVCLPNMVYSLFLKWWGSRLWQGINFWNALSALFFLWTLENFILPLVFEDYVPSQLSACIQEIRKTSTTGESSKNQDNNNPRNEDDPSDAFLNSLPKENTSKYSYASLRKLLQWHRHYTYAQYKDEKHLPIVVYKHILQLVYVTRELAMLSFATGGGRFWLLSFAVYAGMYMLDHKKVAPRLTNKARFQIMLEKFENAWAVMSLGVVRVIVTLLWLFAKATYTHYSCWWSTYLLANSNMNTNMNTTSGEMSSNIEYDNLGVGGGCTSSSIIGSPPFYSGSEFEFLFRIFYMYPFIFTCVLTSSFLLMSYGLSLSVKTQTLPRWWWIICPKKDVVSVCLYLRNVAIVLAWIPATKWVTTYTLEFVLLYGFMMYDPEIFKLQNGIGDQDRTSRDQTSSSDDGNYPSLNPLYVLGAFFLAKTTWIYLVWQPWLPLNLLAQVILASTVFQSQLSFLPPETWNTILQGGVSNSIRVAKLMPLTVYLLGGGWRSAAAVLLPHAMHLCFMQFHRVFPRAFFTEENATNDEHRKWYQGVVLRKKMDFATSICILFWAVVYQWVTSVIGVKESTLSLKMVMLTLVLPLWCLLFFTRVGAFLEKFIDEIPVPSIDDFLLKLQGRSKRGGSSRGGGRGSAPGGKTAPSPASSTNTASSDSIPPMMEALPVPKGATPMVQSILIATNHYSVLGLSSSLAPDDEIRKAKRTLSLATHPDKAGQAPGAINACQRVLQAADVLLDPQKRKQYDEEVALARFHLTGAAAELEEELAEVIFQQTGVDISQNDYIMVACDYCVRGVHQSPVVPDRTASAARYCNQHKTRHPVVEKESWIEKEFAWDGWLPGSVLRYYVCHQGKVYDCSDAAQCAGLLQMWAKSGIEMNSHENYYYRKMAMGGETTRARGGGGGGKSGRGAGASGAGSGPSNAAPKSKKKGKRGRR